MLFHVSVVVDVYGFVCFLRSVLSSLRAALHMACIGQHAETAKVLLELGLPDSEDCCGATAQQLAKKTDVVQVFDPCLK